MENYFCNDIKKGIKFHFIKTNKFKTNLLLIFLTTKLEEESVTMNALIPAVLRRGSSNLKTQEEISMELEEMYGASFNCGIEKKGDNQIIKIYLNTINNNFLPQNEDNLKKSINMLFDILFNPLLIDNKFKNEYVESEKNNIKQIIEGRKDSKATYSFDRCIEEMYKDNSYSLYKFGSLEKLNNINSENLYKQYLNLINNCKIDIFLSGDISEDIKNEIINNENILKLNNRNPNFLLNNLENRIKSKKQEQVIFESLDINQGKLVIGLDILNEEKKDVYTAVVYNMILGGLPSSKLFQNVREKHSLAYTASSCYIKQKANIFIKCGIDFENYEEALKIIKEQIEDMKIGLFNDTIIEEAKKNIISSFNSIQDEQDTEIVYYYLQELSGEKISIEEYISFINNVTKEDIINLANKIQINTIYFLKN